MTRIFRERIVKMAVQYKSKINRHIFHIAEKRAIPEIKLTRKEREVLYYICQGHSMKEVALKMFVSPSTIISHKRRIFYKFQVNSLVRLGVLAERYRLTQKPISLLKEEV